VRMYRRRQAKVRVVQGGRGPQDSDLTTQVPVGTLFLNTFPIQLGRPRVAVRRRQPGGPSKLEVVIQPSAREVPGWAPTANHALQEWLHACTR
jgi:hypothetical protein